MNLKIGITDDHALFRKSLRFLINSFDEMEVVLEAENGIELLEKLKTSKVDVLLLDLQMPEMDGFSTCHKLNEYYPDIKVLILTHLNEQETIRKVLDLNIQGYFTKNTEPQELKNAILKLSNNGFYFEKNLASVIEILIDNPDLASITKSYKPFSKREMQVMKLTLKELNGLEIAEKLCISPKTVEQHKRNLMDKTESKNFIGVIRYALINKLITLKEI
jgi:DNA-binding NarL/FixJ family response regulator